MAETFKHELMDGDLFVARSKGVSEYEAKRSFNTCMTKQEEKQDKEDDLDAQKCLEQL